MDRKEEISDTDSGVILNSGPDSPTTVVKDVSSHTRALKLKQQALEDTLKICLLELKKLCVREAELTGHLSSDYPLLPEEQPPEIRPSEPSVLQGSEDCELSSVEAGLALQQQIYVAAHRLCQEEQLSRAVKRSRLQQFQHEERKLKDLQETVLRLQLEHSRSSARSAQREELMGRSQQLSSEPPASAVDHHPSPLNRSHPPPHTATGPSYRPPENILYQTPPQSLEDLHRCQGPAMDHHTAPIQNSPWMESSLDQPYQKKSHCSSTRCSSAVTPTLPPLEVCLAEFVLPTQSCSAPFTPDRHLRRRQSLGVPYKDPPYDLDHSWGPRRRLTEFAVMSRDISPMRLNPPYCSSSDDSNSEHSVQSYASSPGQVNPGQLLWSYQHQPADRYDGLTDKHISQRCSPPNLCNRHQHQRSPSSSRGYVGNGWGHLLDLATGRLYVSHQVPCPAYFNDHYAYCCGVLSAHVRLSRAPSLRDYPQHPNRGLPRQPCQRS